MAFERAILRVNSGDPDEIVSHCRNQWSERTMAPRLELKKETPN
jgi:hypothetical protein